MSRFLVNWIRYSSLKHLPHKDENSVNGRVAEVEGTLYKGSSLPVEQTFNEAFGDTANTAVVVKIGRLRIQKADETKMLISKMKLFLEQTSTSLRRVATPSQPCKSDWGWNCCTLILCRMCFQPGLESKSETR